MNIMNKNYSTGIYANIYRTLVMVFTMIFINNATMMTTGREFKVRSANVSWPMVDGTFIQSYLVSGWDDEKWMSELEYLKDAGMHYIVLQSTADRVNGGILNTIYPTKINGFKMYSGYNDVVDACLRNAEKMGFKVFLGLNFDSDWWNWYSRDPAWVYERMNEGNLIAAELYDRYYDKYPEAFYGWYWPWEVDNLMFKTPIQQNVLSNAIDINLRFLSSTGRRLPFMLSPYMNRMFGNPEEFRDMWIEVFRKTQLGDGDIFCPQDSVGAGGLDTSVLGQWFLALRHAVDTKPGLLLWSDAETFDQQEWNSITMDRFVAQIKIVQPYVDNIITFAYSHYYSPNVTNPGFHNAYLYYIENGMLDNTLPEAPSNVKKIKLREGGVKITWRAPSDSTDICGYLVFRDGELIKRIQVPRKGPDAKLITSFTDTAKGWGISCNYEVKAYDYFGNLTN